MPVHSFKQHVSTTSNLRDLNLKLHTVIIHFILSQQLFGIELCSHTKQHIYSFKSLLITAIK
jgi:hypothetical protein